MFENDKKSEQVSAKRRRLMQAGTGVLAAAGAMGGLARVAHADTTNGPFPPHKRWRLVFVNHVTTNPFFVATQYGI